MLVKCGERLLARKPADKNIVDIDVREILLGNGYLIAQKAYQSRKHCRDHDDYQRGDPRAAPAALGLAGLPAAFAGFLGGLLHHLGRGDAAGGEIFGRVILVVYDMSRALSGRGSGSLLRALFLPGGAAQEGVVIRGKLPASAVFRSVGNGRMRPGLFLFYHVLPCPYLLTVFWYSS